MGGTPGETLDKKTVGGVSADADGSSVEDKLEIERKNRVKRRIIMDTSVRSGMGVGIRHAPDGMVRRTVR